MTERSLVSPRLRQRVRGGAEPIATAFGRLGLTPNALTVIGFGGSCLAGALAAGGQWLPAGIASLFFAAFDLLDGALARATGRVSRFGAFLDSTLDRGGEAVVYAGLVIGLVGSSVASASLLAGLIALTMGAALLVSYTRARAESLGFSGDVGVAPRPERVVVLGVGLVASGLSGGPAGGPWLQLSIGLLFILSTVTVLQRIQHVRAQAREVEE